MWSYPWGLQELFQATFDHSVIPCDSPRLGVQTWRSCGNIWTFWGQYHCRVVTSIVLPLPGWMGIFFSPMIHFWPCTHDSHRPSLVIQWSSELKKVSSGKLQESLCCNGKSLANSKLRTQSLCRRVKLYLMALFWETRPTSMYTRATSAQKIQAGDHHYPNLSRVRACCSAFDRKCSNNRWVIFRGDCYRASLPMLAWGSCVSSSALRSQPFIRSI